MNDVGIIKLESGSWGYRYTYTKNGRRYSKRCSKDEFGNPLKTKKDAIRARAKALALLDEKSSYKPPERKTFEDVYKEYCERGRKDKAQQTIRKQDSLWENHFRKDFGSCFVDDVAVADVQD